MANRFEITSCQQKPKEFTGNRYADIRQNSFEQSAGQGKTDATFVGHTLQIADSSHELIARKALSYT